MLHRPHRLPRAVRQRGFALATAILAIVVIGSLIAGVFFAATQQYRLGRNEVLTARATAAAEYGTNRTIAPNDPRGWSPRWDTLSPGDVDSTARNYTLAGGEAVSVRVTRIGDAATPLYLVASEGRAGGFLGARARRRTSTVVR
ncbi:MAG: hypothetical protein M3373_02630, partial [Gemmatimonadota bacterium]|nr:hypothetical protein [Gemmatimonadota bacterium]